MKEEINNALKKFTRGLGQNSVHDIYNAHKALYKIGEPALPAIKNIILEGDWAEKSSSLQIRYISGLLSLIRDINESEAKIVADDIKKKGCNSNVTQRIKSICKFTIEDYVQYSACGINVYEYKDIKTGHNIKSCLEEWLANVPQADLTAIERLYVIPEGERDYLGTYTPIFCNIMIEWNNLFSTWNPLSSLSNFLIKKTLYHEIGHHVHQHTLGQNPEQEEEANKYATSIIKASHPKTSILIKYIYKILVFCGVAKRKSC